MARHRVNPLCPLTMARRPALLIPTLPLRLSKLSCLQPTLQICTFVFNNFQDAPLASLFFSWFCIVAGGGYAPAAKTLQKKIAAIPNPVFRIFFQVPYPLTLLFSNSSQNGSCGGLFFFTSAKRRAPSGTHPTSLPKLHFLPVRPTMNLMGFTRYPNSQFRISRFCHA